MKFKVGFIALLSSLTIANALVITVPQAVMALTAVEVNKIAQQITVLIDGQNPGSGIIFNKDNNIYYVLTAEHVVDTEDKYTIQTPDGKRYPLIYNTVKKFSGVDLAVLQFTSNKSYRVAKLGNSDQVSEGSNVYIAGFSNPGTAITERIYEFKKGEISAHLKKPHKGYALVYDNLTRAGMSGGPVLDDNARVVGIHGLADTDSDVPGNESGPSNTKNGRNLGIPINTFVKLAKQIGMKISVESEETPPQPHDSSTTGSNPPSTPGSVYKRPPTYTPSEDTQGICAGRCN